MAGPAASACTLTRANTHPLATRGRLTVSVRLPPAGRVTAPALVIAGGRDVIHPPATVKQTADRLAARFEVLREMSHWLPGEPGWDEVAALCLDWLSARRQAAA